jgi:hypothetical protein
MTTRETKMENRRGVNHNEKTYRRLGERHKGITSRHEQEEKKTTDHDDFGYRKGYRIKNYTVCLDVFMKQFGSKDTFRNCEEHEI